MRNRHHERAIGRQEHERQLPAAAERGRDFVGQAGDAVLDPEEPLDNEGEAERQEQAVEMVEPMEAGDEQALDDNPAQADDDRHQDESPPEAEAEVVEQHPGDEGAHHVLGAMREVDDVEEAEDDRQPEAEDGVERAVDQA